MATADLLISIGSSGLLRQAEVAEANFEQTIAAQWPKLAKASRFMFALGWIGGVSSVVIAITKGDWKKMSTLERTEFVTSIVQLTATSFKAIPLIWGG